MRTPISGSTGMLREPPRGIAVMTEGEPSILLSFQLTWRFVDGLHLTNTSVDNGLPENYIECRMNGVMFRLLILHSCRIRLLSSYAICQSQEIVTISTFVNDHNYSPSSVLTSEIYRRK
jgi:hypothetical protein